MPPTPTASAPPRPSIALARWWRALDPDRAWLVGLALLYLASGLAHGLVFLVDGGSWAGPVSWRKPIVFGLSGGITTLSLAWVLSAIPATRGRRRWARLYGVTMTLELWLITLQAWRGVGSHFNTSTPLDAAIWTAMGLLIAAASAPIVAWTLVLWRRPTGDPAEHRARLHGMALLVASLGVGMWIASHGTMVTAGVVAAPSPSTFGAAGPMKVPHALGLHGLQVLPLLAVLLRRAGVGPRARLRGVGVAAGGYWLLLGVALAQVALGRVPWDLSPGMMALAGVGLGLLGLPLLAAAQGRPPATHPTREGV